MPRAVSRIRRVIANRERVGIFGDYDCDGITASALLVRWFRRQNMEPLVRLPHRVRDGYGLKLRHIDEFAAAGISLLLTVDTGITAVAEITAARERGIDVIVTDHHHLRDEVPQALAILHPALAPHRSEASGAGRAPTFALPHPSGAGVAHYLVRALEGRDAWEGSETDLALAAIGTIADLVELRGTNRTMVQEGLRALNGLTAGPLAVLAASVQAHGTPLTSTDVAFRLAPRINAAGRMEDPEIALRALLEGGEALAAIDRLNTHRQDAMGGLFAEAWKLLGLPLEPSESLLSSLPPLLSIDGEQFPEGLIGLIAGKLTEATGHPSFIVTIRDGECTASLRSTAAYHITEGLECCADLLLTFGGHAQAAGCTFPAQNLAALRERLGADIAARTVVDQLRPSLELTASLQPRDITLAFLEHLKDLEPFGQGNPEPSFLIPAVRLESVRRVGEDGKHLQARIGGLKAIGFRLGHLADHATKPLDIACRISVDTWNGRRAPQIVVEDVRVPATVSSREDRKASSEKVLS